MNFNKEFFIRSSLIFLGILIIIYSLYNMYTNLSPLIDKILKDSTNLELIINFSFGSSIFILIFGYIIYYIGRNWKNSFKKLSKTLISISAIFLSFAIIFFVINTSSQQITNTIQPSFDTIIMSSIDLGLNSMIEKNKGKNINLLLSKNSTIKKFYTKNLSLEDSKLISKSLDLNNYNDKESLIFSKFFISTTYKEILKTNKEMLNVPIPISSLKESFKSQGVDINTLKNLNISLLELMPLEKFAYLTILISTNQSVEKVIIGNISKKNINLIWKNLQFNEENSLNTKNLTINLLLSQVLEQLQTNQLKNTPIPISSFASLIPKELKNIFKYDFLSKNISKRVIILNNLRSDCKDLKINKSNNDTNIMSQICNFVKLSEFNYLMSNIKNLSIENNISISNKTLSNLENYNSLDKIKIYIEDSTNSWKLWTFLTILFITLSIGSYFTHFKFNNEEFPKFHIGYYISKLNLINTMPMIIITYLIYYLIANNIIVDYISQNLNQTLNDSINIILSLPIYLEIINIMESILKIYFIIIVINIILLIFFYLKLKNELKEEKVT